MKIKKAKRIAYIWRNYKLWNEDERPNLDQTVAALIALDSHTTKLEHQLNLFGKTMCQSRRN